MEGTGTECRTNVPAELSSFVGRWHELASVRVRSLSVQQIFERLGDRFALLPHGSRSALPRQQTLRALIDWSYDLLGPQERLVRVGRRGTPGLFGCRAWNLRTGDSGETGYPRIATVSTKRNAVTDDGTRPST